MLLICIVSLSCVLFFKMFNLEKLDLFSRTAHVCVFHACVKHVFVFSLNEHNLRFNRLLTTPFDVVASVNQAM